MPFPHSPISPFSYSSLAPYLSYPFTPRLSSNLRPCLLYNMSNLSLLSSRPFGLTVSLLSLVHLAYSSTARRSLPLILILHPQTSIVGRGQLRRQHGSRCRSLRRDTGRRSDSLLGLCLYAKAGRLAHGRKEGLESEWKRWERWLAGTEKGEMLGG